MSSRLASVSMGVPLQWLGARSEGDGALPPRRFGCPSRGKIEEDRPVVLADRVREEKRLLKLEVEDEEEGLPQSRCFVHRS